MRIANQAVVSGSSWTSASPLLRKLSTAASFPGLASSRTSNATVTMIHLLLHIFATDIFTVAPIYHLVLEIDFQKAIGSFKPSGFAMIVIAQSWRGKEGDGLVRFRI